MKEFYLKYKIFVIPFIVSLVCLIIIIFVIIPQILEFFSEREKIRIVMNRIDLLNNKAIELGKIDETKLKQDLTTTLIVMPTDRDIPQAMAVLENLITKSNLSLKSTSYGASSTSGGPNSFSLTVSLVGSVASTRFFLNSLSEGSRIFNVESISLRLQPQGSDVSVDIPLNVFYQSVPTKTLTLDQPVAKIDTKEDNLINNLSKFTLQQPSSATTAAIPVGKADPFQ